jgi:hypothetical protein
VPHLQELLNTSNSFIKAHAAGALITLGHDVETPIHTLVEVIDEGKEGYTESKEVAYQILCGVATNNLALKDCINRELQSHKYASYFISVKKGLNQRYGLPVFFFSELI